MIEPEIKMVLLNYLQLNEEQLDEYCVLMAQDISEWAEPLRQFVIQAGEKELVEKEEVIVYLSRQPKESLTMGYNMILGKAVADWIRGNSLLTGISFTKR